jgi:serine/threonine protein kinase
MNALSNHQLAMIGIWEILIILIVIGVVAAVIVAIVVIAIKLANRKQIPTPPMPPTQKLEESRCPRCGTLLGPGVAKGLCPRCVMAAGFETQGATHTAKPSTPDAAKTPKPAELAVHFPHLEIADLIGRGGMGWVYRARQKNLDRVVALKVLPPVEGKDPAFAERFQREARALARLNHPNIVAIYDFGQAGPYYYFMMEFVEGPNLRQLERTRKLSPEEAFAIVPKICEALQYAHDEGIVHRDIKPENILLDNKGRLKIADFGIAKIVGRKQDITLTGTQHTLGTPHYMSPEQIESPNKVDHRTDIYALGVVFYEMLTGELPMGHFELPSKRLQVDVRVDEVVLKSLERNPEKRYQTVGAVKTDVEGITRGNPPPEPSAPATSGANSPAPGPRTIAVSPDEVIPTQDDPVQRTDKGTFSIVGRAWTDWWAERAKWFTLSVQIVLVIAHLFCLGAFFGTTLKSIWDKNDHRQFTYTVGAGDPWFTYETYPTETTPFRFAIQPFASSMLFLIAGFAFYYFVWRIEKVRNPKAGFWCSPAPLAILWGLWAVCVISFGMFFGQRALKEERLSGPFAPQLRGAIEIRSGEHRDEALCRVALQAAAGDDVTTVHRALGEIRSGELHDRTAADCALELAKLNKNAEATAVARKIRSSAFHDTILERIASGSATNNASQPNAPER